MRFQLVSIFLQGKTAGEWMAGYPPGQRGLGGGGQSVILCPEALPCPVSLKQLGSQKSQAGVWEVTSYKKPSESLANPALPLCPLVPPAGVTWLLSPED
jgi:hypothetical protein